MTRIARAIDAVHHRAGSIRDRVSARKNGKTLVYLAAGLAVAGAGTATTTGLVASTGSPPGPADSINRVAEPNATVPQSDAAGRPDAISRHQARAGRQVAGQHRAEGMHVQRDETWTGIERIVAAQTEPSTRQSGLPAQDRLTPTGTSGPQSWLPITPARYANAATIVHQALDKKMGLRSAVIAVATAMQESTLLDINYGTYDSVGLFQQRPSAGWGTVAQIMHPAYAADAFLNALRTYQANNPSWAHEPLWQSAQGVQNSAFPYAYAKWEAQAAQLVGSVTRKMV